MFLSRPCKPEFGEVIRPISHDDDRITSINCSYVRGIEAGTRRQLHATAPRRCSSLVIVPNKVRASVCGARRQLTRTFAEVQKDPEQRVQPAQDTITNTPIYTHFAVLYQENPGA